MRASFVPIDACQPSQLLVSDEKLAAVLEWIDADEPDVDPLPVLEPERLGMGEEVPGNYVLADGHTRALTAVLCGADSIPVTVLGPDEQTEMNLDVYRQCLEWCLTEGITTPSDLVGCVVSADTYREEWIERCQRLTESGSLCRHEPGSTGMHVARDGCDGAEKSRQSMWPSRRS